MALVVLVLGLGRGVAQAQARPDCGLRALRSLARQMNPVGADAPRWTATPAPGSGWSVADLQGIGARGGMALVGVERQEGGEIPVPSVMHGRCGHYVALLESRGGWVRVAGRRAGEEAWEPVAGVLAWGSGVFLVPEERVPPGWRRLSALEASRVRGGLEENPARAPLDDDEDEACPTDEEPVWFPEDPTCPASPDAVACPVPERCPPGHGEGECGGLGLASWHVSEPFINLWDPIGENGGFNLYDPRPGSRTLGDER